MNARDFNKDYVYGLGPSFYQPNPERPANPPEPPETNLELAKLNVMRSLADRKGSLLWDDFMTRVLDELDCDLLDKIVIATTEEESLELLKHMTTVLNRAVVVLANENLDLGRIA